MPIISSLRSQRLAIQRPNLGQQYVTFRLRVGWFAVAIQNIYRIIPLEKHIPKITFSGQNVPIVDLGKILFGNAKVQAKDIPQLIVNGAPVVSKPSMVIIRNPNEDLVGILCNSQPALQMVTQDQLVPLPPTYSQRWKVDFIDSMTLPAENVPSLFLIDSDRLINKILSHTNSQK